MATSKARKTRFVGTHKFLDAETKELHEMNVISVEDRDRGFDKIWLACNSSLQTPAFFYLYVETDNDRKAKKCCQDLSPNA